MSAPTETRDDTDVGRILVVDDEFSVRDSLEGWFRKDGYDVAIAADATEALHKLQEQPRDIVLLDIRMPGIDGMELQRRLRELDPDLVVIMITAFASVDTAVQAMKEGAFDYVTKPIDPDELSRLVVRGLETRRAGRSTTTAGAAAAPTIVAGSPAMRRVLELARAVAGSDTPLVVRGESGTGRELLARFIHATGTRRNFPFVKVACGAFTDETLESELFGHEKLAFEGARFRRQGKLEMASGGTLLLEEADAMGPRMQFELERALETGKLCRLGGNTPIAVDVRLIATTSVDLAQRVREGRFREDLFFRLDVVSITVPPLRERREDIPVIAAQLLERTARRQDRPFERIDAPALRALLRHPWPGNVRELERAIAHAVVVGTPPEVREADLALGASG